MIENFRKLGLIEPILKAIVDEKFDTPSSIQEKAIPLVVSGKDVIGGASTGSGKTLVFGAGIIKFCDKGRGIQSLILTPTRELAEQVSKALQMFSKYKPLEIIAIYGGVSILPQIHELKTADVVVGTPGRILDHMQRKTIDLSRVKILVLDEADRMLDMGFIEDVEKIIRWCPKERQTLMFSATISRDITYIADSYMKSPIEVEAEAYVDPRKLTQVYYDVPDNMKFSLLVHLLKHEHAGLVMVFCNSRQAVDFVANNLILNGVEATAIHGGFSQSKRTSTMTKFHAQKVHVLVCTDVAARGLDIPGVSHVYNFDIPKESKQYIHRIGRTARAGKEGKAINLLSQRDFENFDRVLRDNDVKIAREEPPHVEKIMIRWTPKQKRFGGGRFGGRPGQGHFGRGHGRGGDRGSREGRTHRGGGRPNRNYRR